MSGERSALTVLVTGATGLLGSHLVEQLRAEGHPVRALVRTSSDTSFLDARGVETVRGDLTDRAACDRACQGVVWVFHAASRVGDWGRPHEFERDCLEATRTLARSAIDAGVRRFVHVSSTSAYGHPPEGGPPVDELALLGQNLWPLGDHYTRAKVGQERILWRLSCQDGLPLSIIRPSWLYGERDRTTMPRLVRRLRHKGIPLIGKGDNPLSAIYAGEVARAALLAAHCEAAAGQAFNVTDQGPITQREFFDLWATACGAAPVGPSLGTRSYALVWHAAGLLELASRVARRPAPPVITRYATWLMARDVRYSTLKARRCLGWTPRLSYAQSIERSVRWFDAQAAAGGRIEPVCVPTRTVTR